MGNGDKPLSLYDELMQCEVSKPLPLDLAKRISEALRVPSATREPKAQWAADYPETAFAPRPDTALSEEIEVSEEAPAEGPDDVICVGCGSINKCRTLKWWTDCGYEYDLECTECGSTEIEESEHSALMRVIDQRDKLAEQIEAALVLAPVTRDTEVLVGRAQTALRMFDDTVDMNEFDSVSAWWNKYGASVLDAIDKAARPTTAAKITTPVDGSCPQGTGDGSSPSQKLDTKSRFDSSGPALVSTVAPAEQDLAGKLRSNAMYLEGNWQNGFHPSEIAAVTVNMKAAAAALALPSSVEADDAARYRWVREQQTLGPKVSFLVNGPKVDIEFPSADRDGARWARPKGVLLDRAIDAAREKPSATRPSEEKA